MGHLLRVIVADDEACVRNVLAASLRQLGYAVTAVADGCELVDACRESIPDLVISDVRMPVLDGLSAAAVVRYKWPVPIILMSGSWGNTDLRLARELGATVLAKPILPLKLVEAIEQARGGTWTRQLTLQC